MFEQGFFPDFLKHAVVQPILKKPNLDSLVLKSYRPISNLSFISKLIERLAINRFNYHISTQSLLPVNQSAYRCHHSTETAVVSVFSNIARSIDNNQISALVLLDMSAAFDTVDHAILMASRSQRRRFSSTVYTERNTKQATHCTARVYTRSVHAYVYADGWACKSAKLFTN